MQQHEHAQRTVGERERPVARSNERVTSELHDDAWSEPATLPANSAKRKA